MKTKILNKPHEGDIWQLSIYAHIQFLTAPDRMLEYRSVLKACDECGHPMLYIAAVKYYDKPLIARYIAESMSQVGYNPSEVSKEQVLWYQWVRLSELKGSTDSDSVQ